MKKYSNSEMKEMYERNIDRLYKITYTYFKGNISLCEDAIQDVFLTVFEKNIRFDSVEYEKAWFIVAIKNKCKNMLKSKWNEDISIDRDYEMKEEKEDNIIDKVMNLPEKYKLPIYLYYYEEYTCLEIAKMLNKPENTIYSYLNRGRKILRLELEEELK